MNSPLTPTKVGRNGIVIASSKFVGIDSTDLSFSSFWYSPTKAMVAYSVTSGTNLEASALSIPNSA